jgi:hypothetical protein
MITVFETRERTESISEVQQSLRMIMDRISNTTVGSDSISANDGHTLLLTLSGSTVNPTVFFMEDGQLFVQEGTTSQPQRISSNTIDVDKFDVRTVGDTSVSIYIHAFELGTLEGGEPQGMEIETTLTLRK